MRNGDFSLAGGALARAARCRIIRLNPLTAQDAYKGNHGTWRGLALEKSRVLVFWQGGKLCQHGEPSRRG